MREETVRFESYDVDPSGNVRPSAVMRRMQQAAREDLNSFGITYEDMRKKNMAFVVSKMAIVFERPLPGEIPIQLLTAPNPVHGVTFPRSFRLFDEKGAVIRAMSLWALLDFEKRSLLRATALGEEIPSFDDVSGGVSCMRLIKPKDKEPILVEKRRVYASMLDQNNHLNNCNYADLATDLLPENIPPIREIQISFQHEARRGDVLQLEGYTEGEGYLVVGTNLTQDQASFMAYILTF